MRDSGRGAYALDEAAWRIELFQSKPNNRQPEESKRKLTQNEIPRKD
jgi:hypothetical protein